MSPEEEPPIRADWRGLNFEDAEELATEASKLTGKVITAPDVEALLGYSPAYDGDDLWRMVGANGGVREPRPKRAVAERLLELRQLIVEAGPEASVPLPTIEDMAYDVEDGIDNFLDALQLSLTEDNWLEAREFVYPALDTTAEPEAALQKVLADLRAPFPGWQPPDSFDKAKDAFSALWDACKAAQDMQLEHGRRWRTTDRIAGKMVNRAKKRTGRRRSRLPRRAYVAELIFNYLCFRVPITERDLDDVRKLRIQWKKRYVLRRALEAAAATIPPPRKAKHIIMRAYEGPSDSDLRKNFRRRVYHYIRGHKRWWKRLKAGKPLL